MRAQSGFTLLELIIALIVVGVLTAMAVPSYRITRVNTQISGMSGDMVTTLNMGRRLAISTRTPVFVVKGAGSSAADTAVGESWASGWRVFQGATLATATPVTRVERNGGFTDINVLVTNGKVDAAGKTDGAALNTFVFNNFGQLTTTASVAITQAVVVICAPKEDNERGRVLTVSRLGRTTNISVNNPESCGE